MRTNLELKTLHISRVIFTLLLSVPPKPGQVCELTSLGQDAETHLAFQLNRQSTPSSCWGRDSFMIASSHPFYL